MITDSELAFSRKVLRNHGEKFTEEAINMVAAVSPKVTSREVRLLLAEYYMAALGSALLSFQNEKDAEAFGEIRKLLDRHLSLIHSLKASDTTH